MSRSSKKSIQNDELPELLSASEAADFLSLSPITLSHYRCQGRGPVYRKQGWRIFYAKPDLIDWSGAILLPMQKRRGGREPAAPPCLGV